MASNRFIYLMLFRVILLLISLVGFSLALIKEGYYFTTLLMLILVVIQIVELNKFVSKTNAALTRFLEAARCNDFSQRFYTDSSGAGFDGLTKEFSDIMNSIHEARQEQALTLRHLKSLTEQVPVPLLSLYPDGRIQLQNIAARKLFGRVSINKLDDLRIFGEHFVSEVETLEVGERRLVAFAHDDVERQLALICTQLMTGPISEKLISLQDIQTELDSVQQQSWEDLVRVLTHEIMNSITPIASLAKTASDLLSDTHAKIKTGGEISKDALEDLDDVLNAVDTLARRSDGLMQFVQSYRSMSNLSPPQKQKLFLKDVFERITALVQGQWNSNENWSEQSIDLITRIEPENLELNADPDLLDQVLINLLQNAEQVLRKVEQPSISMSARLNKRGYVIIEVSDNGPGVPENIESKIFIPFFTTRHDGSGVGLALSRQIMNAHHGNISVGQSEAGGARFTLVF